jgi:hypothetical protein
VQGDPINFNDPSGLFRLKPAWEFSLEALPDMFDVFGTGGGLWMPPAIALPAAASPRDIMLKRRAEAHEAIYGTGDTVFGGEILDCIAGRESDWNPNADNGLGFRGMFQMGEDAWADVYRNVPDALTYVPNVFDPNKSAPAAAAYLNIRLIWNIGQSNYASGNYTEADLKAAIRDYNGSSIAVSYANQIWDCAQKLKSGDLNGALKAIGKI